METHRPKEPVTHRPVDIHTFREWDRKARVPNSYRPFPGVPTVVLLKLRGGDVFFDRLDLPRVRQFSWQRTVNGVVQGRRMKVVELVVDETVYEYGRRRMNVLLGRLIANPHEDQEVVHRNGDKTDFRRDNLLGVRRSEYRRMLGVQRGPEKGRYKGVSEKRFRSGTVRYQAETHDTYLGLFETPEDAARAYDLEALARYGPVAYLNFPEEVPGREDQPRR